MAAARQANPFAGNDDDNDELEPGEPAALRRPPPPSRPPQPPPSRRYFSDVDEADEDENYEDYEDDKCLGETRSGAAPLQNAPARRPHSHQMHAQRQQPETIRVKLNESYFARERHLLVGLVANARNKVNSMRLFNPIENDAAKQQREDEWSERVSSSHLQG